MPFQTHSEVGFFRILFYVSELACESLWGRSMKMNIKDFAAVLTVAIALSYSSVVSAQLSGTQTFTVTVDSALSITPPSGGNATLAHDTTDANQSFSSSDTDWDVISNSGTGATVTFTNDGLFTNTVGANTYTRNLTMDLTETTDTDSVWAVSGAASFTSTSGTPIGSLQAVSTGPGHATLGLNVTFLDTDYSLLPAGSYVMTVTGTVAANP